MTIITKNICLDEDLFNKSKQICKSTGRTFSGFVRFLIEREMEKDEGSGNNGN
ncbi:MAG: hypothetical protein WC936_01935 [Candidatus Nanoarchaeia archaeon]|jgi:predicted DNA-binding protein